MKIHKEIVWNKGVNPRKDGKYLFIEFWKDGSVLYSAFIGYTVAHGWNTSEYKGNFDVDGVDINLVRFLENHEEVREALEVSLVHWMETEKTEYITSMIEECE